MALGLEMQLVRETLEGALAPSIATAVLFEALDRAERVPATADEVLALAHGPLGAILTERLGSERRDELIAAIEERLALAADNDLDVEIDVDERGDEGTRTVQMLAVPHPVSVLVVSGAGAFADRLLAALGPERVYPHTVGDEAALRHATFSIVPMVAVVDAAAPSGLKPSALATAMRSLPDRTLPIVWAEETVYGREVRARLQATGRDALFLARAEGIGPLLDLVLSRFKQSAIPPPPSPR